MSDLISRDAAIEYLITNMNWLDEDGYEVDDADKKRPIITDLVNGIPAVDEEPVRTATLIRETDRERHWHCSRCGKVFGLVGLMHKYCPECGARLMGGGRDAG